MDLRLRPVVPGDIEALQAIGPDRAAYLGFGGDPPGRPNGGPDWAKGAIGRVEGAWWGRIIEIDGKVSGEVKLQFENLRDRHARLAVWVYDQTRRDEGVGQRAISQALDEAFGSLALHRVELHVLATNTRAIRCYEAAGFQHEGRLRDNVRLGDTYADELVMAILATDPRPNIS